ncbi:MAG: hypothetical protein LBD43_01585 [Holosporales bacterium]|jgi:hypothetical protein|nr:hypothetical protein [Holosporales bacterium]
MKAALLLVALLIQAQVFCEEQPWPGDVNIRCDCEKDMDKEADSNKFRPVDRIPSNWTAITGIYPPDIRNIVIKSSSEFLQVGVN